LQATNFLDVVNTVIKRQRDPSLTITEYQHTEVGAFLYSSIQIILGYTIPEYFLGCIVVFYDRMFLEVCKKKMD